MKQTLKVIWNLALIALGCLICAFAVKGILIPKQFLAGGLTGLSMLLHYLFSTIPVGVIYFALSIPLFVVGWMFVGRRFFFFSLAGASIYSVAMMCPFPVLPIEDMILSTLAAGMITGVGSGIILRSLGSAGGLDILTVVLYKKYALRPGTVVLTFNSILMLLAALRIPLEMVLYTLIFLFVSTHFFNLIITGLSQRKSVMIISTKWKGISLEIMNRLNRGVTIVSGQGGFSGKEMRILYSVITLTELSRFKELIRRIDPEAFVVVTDTLEVMGKRIGNQPHW